MATSTPVDSTLGAGVTQAGDVITNNMPAVFGISVAFVAWHIGKRVLGKI